MSWDKRDSGHRGTAGAPSVRQKAERAPAVEVPQQANLDDPENLPSCFEAMGVAEHGIWGNTAERFPAMLETELRRDFNWPTSKDWEFIRRAMTRDTEAV